jgi:serine/threonine protein phosphatase PrpC
MNTNHVESVFQLEQNVQKGEKEKRLELQIGHDTDIGGSKHKPNQDRKIFIPFVEHDGCLIGVADGHGTKGEVVAEIAEKSMNDLIRDKMAELLENPVQFLEYAFEYIHGEIIKDFADFRCGTTFSLILVLDKKLWIANVGDSTGILCAKHPIFKQSHLKFEKDVAIPGKVVVPSDDKLSEYIVLTSEGHSPENPEEYKRMRAFKPSEENSNHAELLCVYDKPGRTKTLCPPVFNISEDGEPTVRTDVTDCYVKNVRSEKAAYVSDRNGEYVLASTRALADNALNKLGVSHKPEISSMDLNVIFGELKAARASRQGASEAAGASEAEDPITVCVVLCSDGVWDNWIFDHVQKFVMDKSCLNAIVVDKERGAQRVCKSFMLRNQAFANKNFGSNSDNATGIVMYITEK